MTSTGAASDTSAPQLTWLREGTSLLLDSLAGLPDEALADATNLPGWTRAHVVAHVAANGEALGRLLRWGATGVESAMYDSGEQRAAEIDKGARLDAPTLRTWATASASTLEAQVVDFPPERWAAKVVTARGRTVPVSQVLWLRTREVAVHAIDLCAGVEFRDLPHDLCRALVGDIAAHRSGGTGPSLVLTAPDATSRWVIKGVGAPRYVELPVADLAAWLSGREVLPDFPQLSAWL